MEEKRILVVLADTADRPIHAERAVYERMFERVAEYYREVSNERVRIVSTVIGPIQMPLGSDFYLSGPMRAERIPANAESLAQDAIVGAIGAVEDVRAFDHFVVVASATQSEMQSHRARFSVPLTPPATFRDYAMLRQDASFGVVCHELGHLLFDWPELPGAVQWCLMNAGLAHPGGPAYPSAWCRAREGWVEVRTVTQTEDVTITPRVVVRVGEGSKYFLIENRQEPQLPAQGLLVWKVDEEDKKKRVLIVFANPDDERAHPFPGSSFVHEYETKDPVYLALRAIPHSSEFMKVRVEAAPPKKKRRAV